mmetsp:Transcript_103808/g.203575  ORF Transcript_103808/g.203575 Transcript_103808/m.203575 type:complete len:471 (-) Transcript_103808:40-1452(-)
MDLSESEAVDENVSLCDDLFNFLEEEFDLSHDHASECRYNESNECENNDIQEMKENVQLMGSNNSNTSDTDNTYTIASTESIKTIIPHAKASRKFSEMNRGDISQLVPFRKKEDNAHSNKLVKTADTIPRPINKTIQSLYPQMFFNSVNSGDLQNVQNYFSTFMSGPCTFLVTHRLPSEIGIPSVIQAFSPNLFSHYLLGCFITFPDMILKLGESKITSSCGRSRIVMETDCYATKIYDIPEFNWAPEVEQLSDLYTNLNIGVGNSNQDNHLDISAAATSTLTATPPAQHLNAFSNDNQSSTSASGGSAATATTTNVMIGAGIGTASTSNVFRENRLMYPTGPELKVEASPSRVRALEEVPVIPSAFLHSVVDRAHLLPTPVQVHTKGTITLYIDEHNCMQHVAVDLSPQLTSKMSTAPAFSFSHTTTTGGVGGGSKSGGTKSGGRAHGSKTSGGGSGGGLGPRNVKSSK